MKFSFKYVLVLAIIAICIVGFDTEAMAQCPMCKMSAEANLKDGGTAGKGLNRGILYMLTLPYMLVFGLGFLWWKNRRRLADEIYNEPFSNN